LHGRHLITHEGHLTRLAPFEKKAVEQAADMIPEVSLSGTPEKIREKVATLEALGVTEIAYQPAGPDIEGELQRMAEALSR
jgi:5,10-methylenetetrahydromethanopterin reductase